MVTRGGDTAFRLGQLRLQIAEIRVRLQLRIRIAQTQEAVRGGAQLRL